MSDRRVPRFEDDTSAELPTWPPRETTTVSSQGAYHAPPAAPPVCPPTGGAALSDSAELLLGLIASHDGVSRGRALERAVAFYADRIGIAALARPMQCGGGDPTPALRADPPREGEGGRGGAPP